MRTRLVLLVRLAFALSLASSLSAISLAQNKQEEGEKLIRRAEQISDIRSVDSRPFHLKATLTGSGDGATNETGTYTETWVSGAKWRRESVVGAFHRTEVGSGKKRWILDTSDEIPGISPAFGTLMHLVGVHQEPIKVAAVREQSLQGVPARCVELKGADKETLCTDAQNGQLLLSRALTFWTGKKSERTCRYGDYQPFGDRTFPHHIQCAIEGHSEIDIRILDLSAEPSPEESLFATPAGAREFANCPGKLSAPRVLHAPDPEYPQGSPQPALPDVIGLTVGSDGRARDMKPIRSMGKRFDDKAMAAVGQWTFQPAMCDGEPVTVPITVEVVFQKY